MAFLPKPVAVILCIILSCYVPSFAQTTSSFNFSAGPQPVSGWINVPGDPSVAVRTATDPATGISISSVATANWSPYNTSCSYDGGGTAGGTFFPAAVMMNEWFQYGATAAYNSLAPQLIISGLSPDSVYTLRMTGSYAAGNFDLNPIRYAVSGATVNGYADVNGNSNTANGAVFTNVSPDASGKIRVYVNTIPKTNIAGISGIQITRGRSAVSAPVVTITNPRNNDVIPEDGNITIAAIATKAGGSIAYVAFYANGTLIAIDSTAPYSVVWYSPDEGKYTLTATASDGQGNTGSASINISVESLSSFWSTTGNISMNADSNFVGNVDSVRLAFRTKNRERMSISPLGDVGIGIIAPTAQFHTTGSVRLAGLKSDSTGKGTRVIVSDTSGNLYYKSGGNLGLQVGEGLGQSSGGLNLGDSIPGPGPHSFQSDRYQHLNGHVYSIGGTVTDPVNHPVFRVYDNGDLAVGTTMSTNVDTKEQTGMRYYAKPGILQIGATDRLDTSMAKIVYGRWPGSGILINTDIPNTIKGKLVNAVFCGGGNRMDTLTWMEDVFIAGEQLHFGTGMGNLTKSVIAGNALDINAHVDNGIITGNTHVINKPVGTISLSGAYSSNADTSWASLVAGSSNVFGGWSQLVSGNWLVNRTPAGTTLGSSNVDFKTLPYTGNKNLSAPGINLYPLFAVGNGAMWDGSVRSNAVTVLYNGRTQINTNGFTNTLTQADVTPKAALDVVSNNSGVLLPRLTTAQRNAIAAADLQNGLILYNTDSSCFQFYNGTTWKTVGLGTGAAGSAGAWQTSSGTTFNESDNIGIGTSNAQGYKLAVNGNAIFTKIRVKAQVNWPDYVFQKDYVLPNLKEVEQYIAEHQHLPGIASAEEVRKEGVDVGGNQAAMLKKIEELTLYVIELNKKVEKLEKENLHLKKKKS